MYIDYYVYSCKTCFVLITLRLFLHRPCGSACTSHTPRSSITANLEIEMVIRVCRYSSIGSPCVTRVKSVVWGAPRAERRT